MSAEAIDTSDVRGAGPRASLLALVLFFVVPLTLRLVPIDHGLPRGYVPDAHVVRAALGMARDRNPVPEVGEYSTYPNLLPYLLLPVYAGYYAHGRVTDRWSDAQEFGDHVLLDPSEVHLLARLLVAFLGALTPWVVYRGARAAGLERGAWVAGWLVTTGLLHTQLSTHERPWVPMVLFVAAALWPAALYAREARARQLLASGVLAGLAFATHQAGGLALGIPGLAWLCAPLGWRAGDLGRRVKQGLLCVAAFGAAAVLVGHPYLLVHGATPSEDVAGAELVGSEGAGAALSVGGQALALGRSTATVKRLGSALAGYDPVVLLLGLAGLVAALRRRATRAGTIWTVLWLAFFMTGSSDHVRYLLPATVLLAVPAGLAAERLARGRGGRLLLAGALALPLVQCVRLALVLAHPDTRAEAEDAVYELPLGFRLAVDRYGPEVDPSLDALERLDVLRRQQGRGLYARERHRRRLLKAEALPVRESGCDVVRLEDLFDFDEREGRVSVRAGLEHLGADPGAVLARLEMTHLLLVDRRPIAALPHPLAGLVDEAAPLREIGPGREVREAFLPTEMDFPLTGLWSVDRPGPRMTIYELR